MPVTKKTFHWTPLKIVVVVVVLVILGLGAPLGLRFLQLYSSSVVSNMPTFSTAPAISDSFAGGEMAISGVAGRDVKAGNTGIIAPVPPQPTVPAGDNAEDYDVTTYSANIETPALKDSCGKIAALKSRKDIIFQSSDENDRACNYTFKATKASTQEVLDLLKGMDPKILNQNVYTIKQVLENYASQEDILKQKEAAVQDTLKSATADYDALAQLARSAKDTESLTKIMNSKIDLIQRLTSESISNNAQLEQLSRAKAEQADQLVYTNFNVSITENTYFNGRDLKDSWDNAVKATLAQLNGILQGLTLGLVAGVLLVIQYGVYAVLLLFVAKYGWRFAKKVWRE